MGIINTLKIASSALSDYPRLRRLRDTTLSGLLTEDEDVNEHIRFHYNSACIVNAIFGDLMYGAILGETEEVDEGVRSYIEEMCIYNIIVFQNVDDIIDDLGMSIERRVSLVDEYLSIIREGGGLSGRDYGFDKSKLEEIAIMAKRIYQLTSNNPEKDIYLDNFTQLARVVQEQAAGKPSTQSAHESALVEDAIGEVMQFIGEQEFSQEDTANLQLSARMGAYTVGTSATLPYLFGGFKDPNFLKGMYFAGASGQLLDDILDYEKDQRKDQFTFMTENPGLKKRAAVLRKQLLSKGYDLLDERQQDHLRVVYGASAIVLYISSCPLSKVLFKQKDYDTVVPE
jgi:hypothetical protein